MSNVSRIKLALQKSIDANKKANVETKSEEDYFLGMSQWSGSMASEKNEPSMGLLLPSKALFSAIEIIEKQIF